eukprot:TRINITY_DN7469_c0_g1_i10.p2 TRINITY_DN7469_c0_g1~~TRINITY_DN7469_c0_g1_i10.p2  ORF type:complete len:113 (+),score=22.34 TRINITY_DN7469_c0_g1_i10:580-918(+)
MERAKAFLSDVVSLHVFPANCSVIKDEQKLTDKPKECPRVLAVTHGGFIKEFVNAYREIKGMGLSEEIAKNTAIYVFRIECSNCKGICQGTCPAKTFTIIMTMENDNTHLKE